MTANAGGERTLAIRLDEKSYAALEQSARGRDLQPAALVERWIRERLAHEAERSLGRERPQRPAE